MIPLTKYEVRWIKYCKGHYNSGGLPNSNPYEAMPLFEEIYAWSPNEFKNDFLNCLFSKLLDIWFKIGQDGSCSNQAIINVFNASFYKSFTRDYDLPIERAISELISMIALTTVMNPDKTLRFNLNEKDYD